MVLAVSAATRRRLERLSRALKPPPQELVQLSATATTELTVERGPCAEPLHGAEIGDGQNFSVTMAAF